MGLRRSYVGKLLCLFVVLGLTACNSNKGGDDSDGGTRSVKPESAYCGTATSVTTATTITATATFDRFKDNATGLDSVESNIPVSRAEVNVLDSNGAIIQCSETDASGNISVAIPRSAGTYTLKVLSRANNSYLKVSVLNNPYDNAPYTISTSFTLSGSETTKSVTLASLSHSGSIAGAFNIYYDAYLANEFLRNNVSYSGCTYCATFTVAPKVAFYWTYGVSPGEFYGNPNQAISFFSPTQQGSLARGIYILGGASGSVCTDTDHFDNSVIIHEYGHFLEDSYAKSDSPGGSHDAQRTIDPRLAWSEGWANFFQGAVLGREYYRDTVSNNECSGIYSVGIEFSLENQDTDVPVAALEGVYREMSVARSLMDAMESSSQNSAHSNPDVYFADLKFGTIWKAFSDTTHGLANPSDYIRNSSLFFKYVRYWAQNNLAASYVTNFDAGITYEDQSSQNVSTDWFYGKPVTAQNGATCTFNIGGSSTTSTRFMSRSNVYALYDFDGTSANSVVSATAGTIYAYDPSDYVHYTYSSGQYVLSNQGAVGSRLSSTSVSLAGKAAGKYLIILTSTSINTGVYFYVNSDGSSSNQGVRLCP